jgi:hypothetical protein
MTRATGISLLFGGLVLLLLGIKLLSMTAFGEMATSIDERMRALLMFGSFIIIVTILAAALSIVLADKYTTNEKHWAFGAIGIVIGIAVGCFISA